MPKYLGKSLFSAVRERQVRLQTQLITGSVLWLSDDDYACRLAVDGVELARNVLDFLSRRFAFTSSEPMVEGSRSSQRIFRIAYNSQLSRRQLLQLLSSLPGVTLTISGDR